MLGISPIVTVYIVFIVSLLGLVMGSFINCTAWRITHGESIAKGRSHCATCGHPLGIFDLIPVFSWLFLGGKCRYCGEKIAFRYPLSELITALLFVSAVIKFDASINALMYCILAVILLGLSLTDIDGGIIPDRFIIAGIVNFLVFTFVLSEDILSSLLWGLLNGLSISVPLLIVVLIADRVLKRESMGGGDIKLLFMLGLYFSWKYSLMAIIFACIIGLLFALVLNIFRRNGETSGTIPFGPSICLAYWLVLLIGEPLLRWYLGLF